jgi:hypothetical protein
VAFGYNSEEEITFIVVLALGDRGRGDIVTHLTSLVSITMEKKKIKNDIHKISE